MFKSIKLLLLLFLPSFVLSEPKINLANVELQYDWNSIEPIKLQDLKFPKDFKWGVATSAHQIEGDCNCQWTEFENRKNWRGKYKIEQAGKACEGAKRYKEDTELIKNLGVSHYRFSIEWSKVEPVEGQFDQTAINHYHDMINHLIKHNVTPVITLHHFTHPQWFEDKKAFEKTDNLKYFVRYCTKMFKEYSRKVKMWCTINEPGVYAFQGYVRGDFPPGKKSLRLAGKVNKNLILAHIYAYQAMKNMPNGKKSEIGITHSITMFDPHNPKNKFECWLARNLNHTFYDAFLQFFVTGKFKFSTPRILSLFLAGNPFFAFDPNSRELDYEKVFNKKYDPKDILDFIGIQPYSHALVDISNFKAATVPSTRTGDIPTDMPYCIYPEIMERAVNVASYIGVPMYITENGIADDKDDRRELYIRRHLYALSKTIEKGYDVRGYFYWSLMDNFEWNLGYGKKFGLYAVNRETQERTLRKGGEYYKKVVEYQNSLKNS